MYLASDVVDLHIDSFIWRRLLGYDLHERHGRGLLDACFYSQSDVPRLRDAHVGGAVWIVTTNPLRARTWASPGPARRTSRSSRPSWSRGPVAICDSLASYRACRARGEHAAFLGIQGGNALELTLDDFDLPALSALDAGDAAALHALAHRRARPARRALRFGRQAAHRVRRRLRSQAQPAPHPGRPRAHRDAVASGTCSRCTTRASRSPSLTRRATPCSQHFRNVDRRTDQGGGRHAGA